MKTTLHASIHAIESAAWDALNPERYPGLLHGFLSSLEDSGSVGAGTGWIPLYLVCEDNHGLAGAMVWFAKTDSYGEYVFDFAFADAYARHGVNYYPKLVAAIPFTPATGPRVLIRDPLTSETVVDSLLQALGRGEIPPVSGHHILFPDAESTAHFAAQGSWIERHSVQFHWFNQQFDSFDAHLAGFTAKRRKETRRERRRVMEQGIQFERCSGHELDQEALDVVYRCYQRTYAVRGRQGYLTRAFFTLACQRIPDSLRVAFAVHQGRRIAMSLCLLDAKTLYGRYWGALVDVDCLHFETCFHQWIEFAIEHGLQRFDPGAQGEHKISRGFQPVLTRSLHRFRDAGFSEAIADYVARERQHVQLYLQDCDAHTPFRASVDPLVIK